MYVLECYEGPQRHVLLRTLTLRNLNHVTRVLKLPRGVCKAAADHPDFIPCRGSGRHRCQRVLPSIRLYFRGGYKKVPRGVHMWWSGGVQRGSRGGSIWGLGTKIV